MRYMIIALICIGVCAGVAVGLNRAYLSPTTTSTALTINSTQNDIPAPSHTPQRADSPTSTTQNNTPVRVPILVYHGVRDTQAHDPADVRQFNIAPSELEKQLAYLKEHGFTTISFKDLDAYFDAGAPLPSKPIILTFDDGWHSQFENALPILKKEGMRATFFLFSNGLDHENFMTWDEAHALVNAGMEIGSHSRSHLYMTKQDSKDLLREVAGSKAVLEKELGVSVTAFAYPFGLYNDTIVALLAQHGFTTGRTLEKSTIQSRTKRLLMPSYLVSNNFKDFRYIVDTVDANVSRDL